MKYNLIFGTVLVAVLCNLGLFALDYRLHAKGSFWLGCQFGPIVGLIYGFWIVFALGVISVALAALFAAIKNPHGRVAKVSVPSVVVLWYVCGVLFNGALE